MPSQLPAHIQLGGEGAQTAPPLLSAPFPVVSPELIRTGKGLRRREPAAPT
ncbi:hypothetical protein FB465_3230 [Kitasatospora atroaurantiaca]|uniref:Uncharacterized protein n=1 Tax=Kitasatospora atroaurantiaca TaxID=285545 RepID=A0A561ERE4_9ACTN|nr:hypothetical protein FB465_3230 [Kitasatospora atroaurantiaca]